MEKRLLVILIVLGILGNVPAAPAGAQGRDAEKKIEETRKKIEEKKKELNGGEWEVTIKSMSGKGALNGPDVLTFQDNVFRSKSSSKAGFSPTNYTLTVSEFDPGPTVWETMQTSGKGQVMFWRGEWLGDKMSGMISRQLEDGKSEEYIFSSSAMQEIPETSESEEEPKEEEKGGAGSSPGSPGSPGKKK